MAELPVAVTMGDPAGVGPEIAVAALSEPGTPAAVIVGDAGRLREAARLRGVDPARLRVVGSPGDAVEPGQIGVLDLANVPAGLPWGRLDAVAGRAGYEYLERAVALAQAGQVAAVCTAPINKEAWRSAGIPHPGHTEALAALTGTPRFAMMLVNRRLRVTHLSTHVALVAAVARATPERCLECLQLTSDFLEEAGIERPRLAVAGINPHAGENGLLGTEDGAQLSPAVEAARARGLDASGPWPADTVYVRAAAGEFDAVMAPYHDQGHVAIKLLGLDTGVNVTIGLPIIRTSVDHGTAFDIAGSGQARPANLLVALRLAAELSARRAEAPPVELPVALDHCVIHVSDWDRSNAFYRHVLGAEVIAMGRGWVYRFGDRQLNLHGPGVEGFPAARLPVQPGNSDLCFRWDGPIEEAAAHLRRAGVDVELGPVPRHGAGGGGTSVYFRDPDGSLLEFISYQG